MKVGQSLKYRTNTKNCKQNWKIKKKSNKLNIDAFKMLYACQKKI